MATVQRTESSVRSIDTAPTQQEMQCRPVTEHQTSKRCQCPVHNLKHVYAVHSWRIDHSIPCVRHQQYLRCTDRILCPLHCMSLHCSCHPLHPHMLSLLRTYSSLHRACSYLHHTLGHHHCQSHRNWPAQAEHEVRCMGIKHSQQ